jgi:hypothetical protein
LGSATAKEMRLLWNIKRNSVKLCGRVNAVERIKTIATIGDGALWGVADTCRGKMQQNLTVNFECLQKGGNGATVVGAFSVSLSFRLLYVPSVQVY